MSLEEYSREIIQLTPWSIYKFKVNIPKDPDTALLAAVTNITTKKGIVPIALTLKNQANPNLYVRGDSGENIHILVYAYLIHNQNIPLLLDILHILIISESKPFLPYKSASIGVKNDNISVSNWFNQRNIGNYLIVPGSEPVYQNMLLRTPNGQIIQERIRVSSPSNTERNLFNIMLDQPADLNYNNVDILLIKSYSEILLRKYNIQKKYDSKLFEYAYKYYNTYAWDYLLSLGMLPGYFLISGMLHHIRSETNTESHTIVLNMILSSIDKGLEMDAEQMSILNIKDIYKGEILKHYETPYWNKVCSINEGDITERLQELDNNLELRATNKRNLCQELSKKENWDRKELIKKRVRFIEPEIKTKDDFPVQSYEDNPDYVSTDILITGNTSICSNTTNDGSDPIEIYNSLLIVSYKDENGTNYCFTPENYREIIATKRNPYNNLNLPNYIVDQVSIKQNIFDKLQYSTNSRNLNQDTKDVVNDDISIKLYSKIPENYKRMTYDQMMRYLTQHCSNAEFTYPYSLNNLKWALGRHIYNTAQSAPVESVLFVR